jgi:undecaprenyl-diphosphatase
VLDLYKNRDALSFNDSALIAVGFIAAFVSGIFVVRSLLDFVSKRGFAVFAWWRIVIGTAGLVGLILLG